MKDRLVSITRIYLPISLRRRLVKYTRWPPVGWVMFGDLGRRKPISPTWGTERGKPVDRYYIEQFLSSNASSITGHVLEIGNNTYTYKFGDSDVLQSDVLHVTEQKEAVTIIGDLTNAEHIPSDTFDCIIVTQTLHLIYEVQSAIQTLHRILKPGGVALCTVPGISQISRYDMDHWGDYWRFTTRSIQRLFEEVFPADHIQVRAYGNVLASVAFLHGLASEELRKKDLEYFDPDYELIISVRVLKPEAAG